jgi:hypothetical protein
MRSVWTLSFAVAAMLAITDYDAAHAVPVNPQPLSAAAPASDIQLAQEVYRGPRGGEAYRGPRGGEAYRGPRGGEAYRGRMAVWRCAALMAGIASANAITEAFGTAPDGATGAAGGGHMA